MLEKLVRAYAEHLGFESAFAAEIAESDGVYTFLVEGRVLCTLEEKWFDELDGNCICLLSALSGELTADELIAAEECYLSRLRQTPLFLKGNLIFTDNYSLGFAWNIEAATVDEKTFPHLVDVYVATVMALTTGDDDDNAGATRAIINQYFHQIPDQDYRNFLASCGIDEEALNRNFGVLRYDDDFATLIEYHDLSGQVILDHAMACRNQQALIDMLYLNGIDCRPIAYDYEEGCLHMITALDPQTTTPEDFTEILLKHRFLSEKTAEYIRDESKKARELDAGEIMQALLV